MLAKARSADAGAGHADGSLTWREGTIEDWVWLQATSRPSISSIQMPPCIGWTTTQH